LYIPIYERIRKTVGKLGLLYVGDCKMAAIETRARIANENDFYLMPLPRSQKLQIELDGYIEQLTKGEAELIPILDPRILKEEQEGSLEIREKVEREVLEIQQSLQENQAGEKKTVGDFSAYPKEVIAQGMVVEIPMKYELSGVTVEWTERRFIVRSRRYADAEIKAFRSKLDEVEKKLLALTPPQGKGRQQWRELEPLEKKVKTLLKAAGMQDYFQIEYERQEIVYTTRTQGGKGVREEAKVRYQIHIKRSQTNIDLSEKAMGWKIYVSNALKERLSLSDAVSHYRNEYRVERNFSRLKGKNLSITPLYLEREDHCIGLAHLLTLALRVLIATEFVVQRQLKEKNEKIRGIYGGNPKRSTARPSAELMLRAFIKITLTMTLFSDGTQSITLSDLNSTQVRILELLGFTENIYTDLVVSLNNNYCKVA
jgi:transposase